MSKEDTNTIGITVEQINIDASKFCQEPDTERLMLLPTKNMVLFPDVTISLALTRPMTEKIARMSCDGHYPVGIVCQSDPEEEWPKLAGLHKWGVVADVLKVIELPDDSFTALVRGRMPFHIVGAADRKGLPRKALAARVELLQDVPPATDKDRGLDLLINHIRKALEQSVQMMPDGMSHMLMQMSQENDPVAMVNLLATNMPLDIAAKIKMLSKSKFEDRAGLLLTALLRNVQEMEMSRDIINKVRRDFDDDQRRMFLQRQMETIHDELYGGDDDVDMLRNRANELALSEQARTVFDREISKLEHINPNNPDYYVLQNYLDTLLSLPWGKFTPLTNTLADARTALDAKHSGLEKVKKRIMEQIALIMHNPGVKAPIICLVGPPGVGKTSLGQAIADAFGRAYQRVSLGGLHDEAEIRGHRRTYIGAMPGRIIAAIKRAGSSNPVIVLDEVDKLGNDYKGDPSSALLEVLDPEQNSKFHDNYIDVDFDLSKVLFIATANNLSTVPRPLLDRMEVINLPGYLAEEKLEISRAHLLPRIYAEYGITSEDFDISDDAIMAVIGTYTNESGVRQLEKSLQSLARKAILAKGMGEEFPKVVEPGDLKDQLGLSPYMSDRYEGNDFLGVVTGLAWTETGGAILLAEASLDKGKGQMTITGNLGNVMKESASIAYQWVKANSAELGIDHEMFEKNNLHVHFPEGAIPKDGPSAGITIATAIASAFSGRKVREKIAMTGEITLRGKVLPVGGIQEKILAAKRAGITDIVMSEENRRDIEDIDPRYIEGLSFHYMATAGDVMRYALI